VLGVIGERPGVSARELAAASGVAGGTLYALLRTLGQRGEIDQQQLPSGHTGYTLAATPARVPAATPQDGVASWTPHRPQLDDARGRA
jgi:DNA-binding IclR family transcriptional regulator